MYCNYNVSVVNQLVDFLCLLMQFIMGCFSQTFWHSCNCHGEWWWCNCLDKWWWCTIYQEFFKVFNILFNLFYGYEHNICDFGFEKKYVFFKMFSYSYMQFSSLLTLKDPFISESCTEIRIELNFYFHTSLWSVKRFYEGL